MYKLKSLNNSHASYKCDIRQSFPLKINDVFNENGFSKVGSIEEYPL